MNIKQRLYDCIYRFRKHRLENKMMTADIRAERLYGDYRELLATRGILVTHGEYRSPFKRKMVQVNRYDWEKWVLIAAFCIMWGLFIFMVYLSYFCD